jgi:hypothetical protein
VSSANGFTNDGTIRITPNGTRSATFRIDNGTLENASTGTIHFQAGGSGSHSLSANVLNFGTVQLDQSTSISGTYTNNGQWIVGSGATLSMTGGTFNQLGGTLDVQGSFVTTGVFNFHGGQILGTPRLTGGQLTIADGNTNAASFILEGNNSLSLPGGLLADGQSLTVRNVSNTILGLTSANGFTNNGSIDVVGTGSGTANLTIASGTLINGASGQLRFQLGGTGGRSFAGNLTNHGDIEVDAFTSFTKSGGVYMNHGQFMIAGGQTLNVTGSGTFEQVGGTLNVAGSYKQTGGTFK